MRSLGNMFISDVNVDRLAPDHQLVWEGIMNINNKKSSEGRELCSLIATGLIVASVLCSVIYLLSFDPVISFILCSMTVLVTLYTMYAAIDLNIINSGKIEKFIKKHMEHILIDGFSKDAAIASLFKGKDLNQSIDLRFTDRILGINLSDLVSNKIKLSVSYNGNTGVGNIRLKVQLWDFVLKNGSVPAATAMLVGADFEVLMVLEMLAQHSGMQLNVEWDRHQKRPILSLV